MSVEAGTLIGELKRRRVVRALVGYAIAAFAVLQIFEPVMHGLHWPEASLSYMVVALAVGFPIVVSLAWIFDVSAGRIERTAPGPLKGTHVALVLVGIGVLAAAPGMIWYFVLRGGRGQTDAARPASIAVLPFANLSGGQENEYFSDGVTEEIINALANIEGIHVVARTSVFSYKGRNVNVRQIGEELNVGAVLEGSVRREGNSLRVVAQLVNPADGYHIWSKTYDRELKGVFSLEDELARAIVQALKPKLLPATALVQQSTSSTEAHDFYLRGRFFWNQRTPAGLGKAAELFKQAIAADPSYALAWSGLADCHALSVQYTGARPDETLPKARAEALKAIELDDSLAEAHASLALVLQEDYEWSNAERQLRRAIELRPGYATAHQWYGISLWTVGRMTEAERELELARQLDPTSATINANISALQAQKRDYERAIQHASRALELDPGLWLPRAALARAYMQAGRDAEALAVLDQATGPVGERLQPIRVEILVAQGDRAAAERVLAQVEKQAGVDPLDNYGIARAHLVLGDIDGTLRWLERGIERRNPGFAGLKAGRQWDPIRPDPRFHALLKRMNLE
jgi:adenylate cyclase